jgi:geranylgeranyl diphosphate synthase type I
MTDYSTAAQEEALLADQVKESVMVECERLLRPFELSHLSERLASGKYFRSSIALCVAGQRSSRLTRLCTALELLHTSTLVHDDILDRADDRRHMPTIWAEFGTEQALLVGNLLQCRSLELAWLSSRTCAQSFVRAASEVNTAQLRELRSRGDAGRTIEQYLDVSRGKTGAMLGLAARVGFSAQRDSLFDEDRIVRAVVEVGIAFQILDDVEDLCTWISLESGGRSKHAVFDIELQNFTLPSILLLMGHPGVASSLSSNAEVGLAHLRNPNIWREPIDGCRMYAAASLARAEQELEELRHRSTDRDRLGRIHDWAVRVGRLLASESLDSAIVRTRLDTTAEGPGEYSDPNRPADT